ncbi:hypothetical protein [Niallia oryzisoli]|uniref:hypothetical protein n=1 Tax=Niallia oryzisoli TaxID=1737571 RepID=UPI003735C8D5
MNELTRIIFEGLAKPGWYFLLVGVIFSVLLIFVKKHQFQGKQKDNDLYSNIIQKMILLSLLIIFIIICLYYPFEDFLFSHFTYDKSEIDVYSATTTVLITSIGVIITAIFSYLIYIATKQGIEIAEEAKNISTEQNRISDELKLIEVKRINEEQINKYTNVNNLPEIKLLMSIDVLIVEIKEILDDMLSQYQDENIKFADALSEGIIYKTLEEKFSEITNKGTDNFIQLLYINGLNFEFDSTYFKRMRLKALFDPPTEVWEAISDDIGLTKIMNKLEKTRNKIIFKVKTEINEVFKELIDRETLSILDSPKDAYHKLWKKITN